MLAAVRVVTLGWLVATSIVVGVNGATAQQAVAPKRLALVVGEAEYPQARLPTADADAGLVATAFAQAGFEVTALADADAGVLRRTIADFAARARASGPNVVLAVYVAGYGLQYVGENWLVPAGAPIDGEVPETAMRLAEFTGPLENLPAATRLFLFDLSRELPATRKGPALAGGLALTDAPVGSIYAYNTAPGAVAPADVPPYGSYARALAEAIQAPGMTIGEVLRRVRLRVGERTDGAAVPFDDGSSDPGFAFLPGAASRAEPLAAIAGLAAPQAYSTTIARDTLPGYADFVAAFPHDPLVGRVRAMAAARREALFWGEAVRANIPRAYWTYMRRYPRGPHLHDVRRQLFALHAALEPPPRFDIVPFEGLPPPPPEELAALEHLTFADADGPPIPAPPATLLPPPRGAFFEALPPAPLAPAGSLPLPLPVFLPDGGSLPFGTIVEPAVPGGALLASAIVARDGLVLVTAKPDAAIVSRLSAAGGPNLRTTTQAAADGAVISRTTTSAGAAGALTTTQFGPADRVLGRAVSRDAATGERATTLFDAGGQAVAATVVSAAGIAITNMTIPGKSLPPRFVLLATRDAKGAPSIAAEATAPRILAPVAPSPAAPEAVRRDASGTDEPKTASMSAADTGKAPALPAAAGLTGQAPVLNIPPPPPAPAFDATAAPVAATPPAPEAAAKPPGPGSVPAAPPPVAPSQAAPASHAPPPAPMPPPVAIPVPAARAPETARLPSEPPLPPRRTFAVAHKGKGRNGR